jgi:predicted ferric reductase
MSIKPSGKANTAAALFRLALYVVIVLSPFIVEGLTEVEEVPHMDVDHHHVSPSIVEGPTEGEEMELPALRSLGMGAGLLGFAMLAMQFVLASRIKWVERPFGLDRVMRFHKWTGVTAGILILAHPIGMSAGSGHWHLLTSLALPWPILLGKGALAVLVVLIVLTLYRVALRLEFQTWRVAHDLGATVIIGFGIVHAWIVGDDLEIPAVKALFAGLWAAAAIGLVYVRGVGPFLARRSAYTVSDVRRETHNVWTVEMAPPAGHERYRYQPGQFQFLTIYGSGLKAQEHPFTVSSSPTLEGKVTSTIKESGDFTVTIGRVKAGDRVALGAPFGRFSYALHPEEKDLVFIAGGIGITPLMSMLRHMRDTGWDGRVTLFYANRTEADIAFRQEIAEMEKGGRPSAKVVHILSDADGSWQGEKGRVDDGILRKYVGDVAGKTFYLCGPPPMMKGLRNTLAGMGVPRDCVRWELFSL